MDTLAVIERKKIQKLKRRYPSYVQMRASPPQKLYQVFKLFFVWLDQAKAMGDFFRIERFSRMLHRMHFNQQGFSESDITAFFENQLLGIEIETHAYCNRTCSFCPNSFLDRRDKTEVMPEAMFNKVIDELAAFGFKGEVKMQRYNEPLANDIIFERVVYVRKKLPLATIGFHSNGDYVTMEKLERLEKAGLSEIFVSLYPDYEDPHLREEADALCQKFISRVGLKVEALPVKEGLARYNFSCGKLFGQIFAFDLEHNGSDRGGSLKNLSKSVRSSPCMSPFVRLYIDWTGDVFPCCNMRADFPEHKLEILGNVKNQNLKNIYFSKRSNQMRRFLADVSEKKGPCQHCQFDVMCSNKVAESILDARLEVLGIE